MKTRTTTKALIVAMTVTLLASTAVATFGAKREKQQEQNPYAEYVWPPPPDDPRIGLRDVIKTRADVEAKTRWKKMLLGASEQTGYESLRKPFGVAFDSQGRLLVTDIELGALLLLARE